HHRMPGERQFAVWREDAHSKIGVTGWVNKRCLGEVHFAGDALHLLVVEAAGFREHGQRIAAERLVREYVKLIESVNWHRLSFRNIYDSVYRPRQAKERCQPMTFSRFWWVQDMAQCRPATNRRAWQWLRQAATRSTMIRSSEYR